jgi:2-dehydropantoate 2-reductase
MRIAVVGVGGVGGYFGGRLAQTDHDVFFIARGAHLEAIRKNGLKVESDSGNFVARPALATDDPAEIGEVDAIVVATKAWQVSDVAESMRSMVGANTVIIPLLNGVEAPSQLAQALGAEHVLGGFCRVLSHISAPGCVYQSGIRAFVAFGEMDNRKSERVNRLREIFAEAEITVEDAPDIQVAMWRKFLFIASFSGVGAVTRSPAGVIRTLPETRSLLIEAMREIHAVANGRNIALPESAIDEGMTIIDQLPHEALASMQRDILDGRPSELEAQNGAVVRLGAEVGIPTPIHDFIYRSLLPAEQSARGLI